MILLSPEKLLVVLVVAVLVLGPDKLPRAARSVSSTWRTLRSLRARLESEARSAFPDLPSLDTVAQAVRSPLAYLERLAADGAGEQPPEAERHGATPAVVEAPRAPAAHAEPAAPGDPSLN